MAVFGCPLLGLITPGLVGKLGLVRVGRVGATVLVGKVANATRSPATLLRESKISTTLL